MASFSIAQSYDCTTERKSDVLGFTLSYWDIDASGFVLFLETKADVFAPPLSNNILLKEHSRNYAYCYQVTWWLMLEKT
jgi:hypothetical protein